MRIEYKVQKLETIRKDVPDHFGHDDSKRGKIVDILVGERRREDLYGDTSAVEYAIADLEEAYSKATRILCLFCEPTP